MASLSSLLRAAPVSNGGAAPGTPIGQSNPYTPGSTMTLPNGMTVTIGADGSGTLGGQPAPGSTIGQALLPPLTPDQVAAATGGGGGSAPAPPGPTGVDWYTQLLNSDPQLAAALSAIASQQAAYQGQTQTAEQQLLEQYGAVPSGLDGQFQSILNPTVTDLANQNTAAGTSTYAQLQKAFQNAQSASLDSLASRGLLRSGATGQDENLNLQNYNSAQASALQTLLGNLGTQQSNLLQQEGTLNQQSETATNDAYQRILSQIQAGTLVAPSIGSGQSTPAAPTTAPKAPAAPSVPPPVPYNPKPPTPEVVNTSAGYALAPGVGGRSGSGGYGYGALS